MVDHCAEAERLTGILTAIITGDSVQVVRFGEDEIRYHKADTAALQRLIDYHSGQCSGRRRRYAIRARFSRPY